MDNLLELNNLEVSFFTPAGEVKAVNGVTYSLKSGEVLGVVGESGSGKSVTASAIMKLLTYPGRITGGSIFFDGKDMLALTEKEMQKIRGKDMTMVFQDPMTSLNPVYTVGNQLIETILHHMDMTKSQAKEHAIHMLGQVGINNPEKRFEQFPHEFSGGMRQRVMIAIALCCNPKLLIADEPTTALDVTIQAQILDLIKKMRTESEAAIILITHDLGIVADICDKVIVMYAGKVVEAGSIDDIYYKTSHPYTKGLLACLPKVSDGERETLRPIEGSPVDMLALPKGCSFASRCDYCMKICLREKPPEFLVADGHVSSCWLHAVPEGKEAGK